MKDFAIFTATITRVNLVDTAEMHDVEYSSTNPMKILDYSSIAYTVDILPVGYRNPIAQVPVLNVNSLTFNPPLPGDGAVCVYLEGENIFPICLGIIYNPEGRTSINTVLNAPGSIIAADIEKSLSSELLPSAAKDESNTETNRTLYRRYDYVQQHQTGSYIRMRNLSDTTVDRLGTVTQPDDNLPEIKIYQRLAASKEGTDSANSIILTETEPGQSTIQIYHHSGAYIKINADGEVIINTDKTIINSGHIELGAGASEKLVLGDSFMPVFNGHSHPTGVGLTGAPIVPMTPSQLSQNNTYTL